jgi:hypothetical protein
VRSSTDPAIQYQDPQFIYHTRSTERVEPSSHVLIRFHELQCKHQEAEATGLCAGGPGPSGPWEIVDHTPPGQGPCDGKCPVAGGLPAAGGNGTASVAPGATGAPGAPGTADEAGTVGGAPDSPAGSQSSDRDIGVVTPAGDDAAGTPRIFKLHDASLLSAVVAAAVFVALQ